MYDPQHRVDLQDSSSFDDSKSWLAGHDNSSFNLLLNQSSLATGGGNGDFDRELFNNLVEMVPLVQSLIDRKATSSFTRRGSMAYTKTPSRESLYKKVTDPRGRHVANSIPLKKKRDAGDTDKSGRHNQDADSFSIFSSKALASEKDLEELLNLRDQVEDLQRMILEKDELLKAAEISKKEVDDAHKRLDELKHQASERDSLIKNTQAQLSNAKIKLADRQAAVEKLQWEAMTSNRKAEKLQEKLESTQRDISSFMVLVDGLAKDISSKDSEDYDVTPYCFDPIPGIDDFDNMEMQKMDEAREAYIKAVMRAKEKQDEDSITAAARARVQLQSFVLKPRCVPYGNEFVLL